MLGGKAVMTTLPVPGVFGGKAVMTTLPVPGVLGGKVVRCQWLEGKMLVDCWATTGNKLHTGALLIPLSLSH